MILLQIQNPKLHNLTETITIPKQNSLFSKDKLNEVVNFLSYPFHPQSLVQPQYMQSQPTLTITKRMKQFPKFCSLKWIEAFRKTDAFSVASKQFLGKITENIPSSKFDQILQIWVLTNIKGENFISLKLITVPFLVVTAFFPQIPENCKVKRKCPRQKA